MSIAAVSQNPSSNATAPVSSNAGSGSTSSADDNMDTTFLNLLITELKSQDPTAPMDATQMVGQMISLNQLDQLIGIHQLLQSADSGAATSAPKSANGGN